MSSFALFDASPSENLLPYDGIVNDYGVIFERMVADELYQRLLLQIAWQHDVVVIAGKRIETERQVAWHGDRSFFYHYSGATRKAVPWTEDLLIIKQEVEQRLSSISPTVFNSCLLNLYLDGSQGMSWHSDDEDCLGDNSIIASLSFGATRKFAFRHKHSKQKVEMLLEHGQLIVMRGTTQKCWQHAIMKSTQVTQPRINLTFRTVFGA